MKKNIALILLAIIAGIFLLELIQHDPGYILVNLFGWTLESSVWFAVLAIATIAVLIYLALRFIRWFLGLALRGSAWYSLRRHHAIEAKYRDGLLHYLSGEWSSAASRLSSVAKKNELPVIRAIAAAQTFAKLRQHKHSLVLLDEALKLYPQDKLWILKARLKILLEVADEDPTDLELTLSELKEFANNDSSLRDLELKTYLVTHRWSDALNFLSKSKLPASSTGDEAYEVKIYSESMREIATRGELDKDLISALWQSVPRKLKLNPTLLVDYSNLLYLSQQHGLLEELISYSLDRIWLVELVDLFAKIESDDLASQLAKAEAWKKHHPDCPVLLITVSVLALKNQLWGKAKSNLEKSISLQESPRAYYLLALLCEKTGDLKSSQAYYKKSAGINWQGSELILAKQ